MHRSTSRSGQIGRATAVAQSTSRRAAALGAGAIVASLVASCLGTVGAPGGGGGPSASVSGSSGSYTLLPARIRRLSNAEFDTTTHALLGTNQTFASNLPTDVRQGSYNAGGFPAAGFTRNAAAVFDTVSAPQIGQAAASLAKEAVQNLSKIAPCTGPSNTACAKSFIESFGPRAYRRPLTADEVTGLLGIYQAGVKDQTYGDGIELVIATILQSAGFLYLTELGGTPSNGAAELTSYEVASALSYFLTGGPPDDTLMQAAAANALQAPQAVGAQATRLLKASSMAQLAVFVEQWLGIDTPPGSSTGTVVSSAEMTSETTAFIEDVMTSGDGSVGSLPGQCRAWSSPLSTSMAAWTAGAGLSTWWTPVGASTQTC